MQETIWIILGTSVATAVITALCIYFVYAVKIKPDVEKKLEKAGDEVEERVRQGVLKAGEELLPKFREKVTEGFTRALAEWPTSEMTRMARTGANLVEEGLSTLLGKKRD